VRNPIARVVHEPLNGLVVDSFAGGGGASTGIEAAIGRPVDIAINHDAHAIAMHKANHPNTRHYQENIWEVDPREACGSRPVALAWFSPDCTHHSRAKGTKPLKKEIRGLAWVVIRWAKTVQPRVIILENVEEFQTWGPLNSENRPDPKHIGKTFRSWLSQLTACGYEIEFRSLVAADYGAPTTRKRLFLIAHRNGSRAAWPDATHGQGRPNPWRTAAEIIDWSIPCPSIFERKRPLAEATMRRIATGIQRYVIEAADPFIIPVTHQGDSRVYGIREPVRTVTAAHRGEFAFVEPFVVRHGHYSTKTGAGLEPGKGAGLFRGQKLRDPLATVCATNDKHLVSPIITKHYGGPNGNFVVGHRVTATMGTITSRDHHSLTAAFLSKFYGTSTGASMRSPAPTITSQGQHIAEVRAFLLKYYGAGGRASAQGMLFPLHTVTTKARFGLVEVHGEKYQIVDIGMRMLAPHELFAAQGFPEDYVIDFEFNGKPLTKEAQIRLAGNSVCPDVAEALVLANVRGDEARAA
jgi:DNA (cytosine-5)-methyltransferase 1